MDDRDNNLVNNLVAAGTVLVLLQRQVAASLTAVEVVRDADGNATNQIDINLSFMASPYRLTVERVRS